MLHPHRRTTDHTENFKFRVNFGRLCARGGEFQCQEKRGVLVQEEGSSGLKDKSKVRGDF